MNGRQHLKRHKEVSISPNKQNSRISTSYTDKKMLDWVIRNTPRDPGKNFISGLLKNKTVRDICDMSGRYQECWKVLKVPVISFQEASDYSLVWSCKCQPTIRKTIRFGSTVFEKFLEI